jgi:hypothetical protein
MGSEHRRLGALLLGAGCLPFAAGALAGPDGDAGLLPPCPFREATGLPCPLCGATRAFALAVRGDGGWTAYNAPWVVLAALTALAGALSLAGARPRVPRRPLVLAAVLFVAVAWAYALAQRGTIVGQAYAGTPLGVPVLVESPASSPITIRIRNSTQITTPIQPSTMPAVALPRPLIRPPEPSISLRA